MNPDFTLIWPLSCPKDGDHFCDRAGNGPVLGAGDTRRERQCREDCPGRHDSCLLVPPMSLHRYHHVLNTNPGQYLS